MLMFGDCLSVTRVFFGVWCLFVSVNVVVRLVIVWVCEWGVCSRFLRVPGLGVVCIFLCVWCFPCAQFGGMLCMIL